MDFELYEDKIAEKIKNEIEKILNKENLSIDEIKFFMDVLASSRIKKMTNLL